MPFELITLMANLVLGAIFKLMAAKQEAYNKHISLAIQKAKQDEVSVKSAREFMPDGGKWTRRSIVFAVILSAFIVPTMIAMMYNVPVNYLYSEESGFIFGYEKLKVMTTYGATITPALTHSALAIVGFYFGSRIGK